ncbi:disulfide bond formation protein B [soil metagenome]
MKPLRINTILWLMAVGCIAAVGIAVYTQFKYDWRPCPWCILQRVIFIAIAIVCIVAASIRGVAARSVPLIFVLVLSVLGIASALWQHFVAARSTSCAMTLADKILSAIGLDSLMPSVFRITGSCAEAAVSMFNVPFEFWSLALFAVLGVLSIYLIRRLPREEEPRISYRR